MHAFAAAGAGFLLAVLWFDLMFDVQTRGHRGAQTRLARAIYRDHLYCFAAMSALLALQLGTPT